MNYKNIANQIISYIWEDVYEAPLGTSISFWPNDLRHYIPEALAFYQTKRLLSNVDNEPHSQIDLKKLLILNNL